MDELSDDEYKLGKPERLFSLTCALLYSKEGLTKHQILKNIPAYSVDYIPGGDNSTLERKFERDKESLRHNGIQLESVIPAHEDENNQATVYLIRRESFYWPKDLKLTSRQLALLNLAAEAWAGGSLSGAASKGITKLRAMGVVSGDDGIIGIAPRLPSHEPNFRELNNAISDGKVVEFEYRNPTTREILKRTLQPWLLRRVAGQWLVLGFDEMRQEPRNFMLKRIVSKVSNAKGGRTFTKPEQPMVDKAIAELEELAAKQIAVIKVKPNSEAWFRYELDLSSKADGKVELHYYDPYLLAEQLREYCDQVEVLKPESLAQLVREGFEKVADIHG